MYTYVRGCLMKRIHLLIDDPLFERLKSAAAGRGQSLADLIRSYLQEQIAREGGQAEAPALSREQLEEMLRIMDARES